MFRHIFRRLYVRAGGALCGAALLAGHPAGAAAQPAVAGAQWPAPLVDTLVRIGRDDQQGRADLFRADSATQRRAVAADSARSRWVRRAAGAHGWPTRAAVGAEAANAAWLVLQHSPFTDWQAGALPTLERLAARGELPRPDFALLTDRVLRARGRPQRYGSQFQLVDGRLVPEPIADPAGLDARRTAMRLQPMAEYARMLGGLYKLPVAWPPAR